jgi:uncharacterized protein YkwD
MADQVVYEDDRLQVIVRTKDSPPPPPPPPPDPPDQSALYAMVNNARASVSAPPVVRDAEAERSASDWAAEMARTGDAHHNPNIAGELTEPWFSFGENIAWGFADEASVHQGWMASDPHRRNIENANFTTLGIGRAAAASGRLYWVEVFVDRQP